MKRMYVCRFIASIIFTSIISLSIMSCDLNASGDTETSLEGRWGHFLLMGGQFRFEGNTFDFQETSRPRRAGTFTRSGSYLTFNSTHEFCPADGGWVPITSPPTNGAVCDHVSFLDSGDPVNFHFVRQSDGTLWGVHIGTASFMIL